MILKFVFAIMVLDSVLPVVFGFTYHYRHQLSPQSLKQWHFTQRVREFFKVLAIFNVAFLLPGAIVTYQAVDHVGISMGVVLCQLTTLPALLLTLAVLDLLKNMAHASQTAVSQQPYYPYMQTQNSYFQIGE